MGTRPPARSRRSSNGHSPGGSVSWFLFTGAVLLSAGCGRTALLGGAASGGTDGHGGAAGGAPGTRDAGTGGGSHAGGIPGTGGSIGPEVGAGGSTGGNRDAGMGGARDAGGDETPEVGADARRDGAADAGRDGPVDRGLDAAAERAAEGTSDAKSDAGRLDVRADGGGWLKLLVGGLGGPGAVDGIGAAARFFYPYGIASDGAGSLFVVDTHNRTIRKLVIATGEVTTLVGSPRQLGSSDGTGAAARFEYPTGIASDGAGSLFVADADSKTIRKVVIATGEVSTLAGSPEQRGSSDGTGAAARFDYPWGIASDGAGNLFVADTYNHTIRKVVVTTGEVTTLAGSPGQRGNSDGTGAAARFDQPLGITSDGAGSLFVVDGSNQTIRKVVVATGEVTTLAGSPGQRGSSDGTGAAARFDHALCITSDRAGNLFVTDSEPSDTIRKVVVTTGEVTTLAGSPGQRGSSDGTGAAARFYGPSGITSDGAGSLFVVDGSNHTIRKVVVATGQVTTLAGSARDSGNTDGIGTTARFSSIPGVASDGTGNLFAVDELNHTVRKVVIATGEVTTFAGSPGEQGKSDGIGAAARFYHPLDVASDGAGSLFVADADNHAIRKVVIATGEVTTLAGRAAGDPFGRLTGVASDGAGSLFVTDWERSIIHRVVIATGAVTTVAGSPGYLGSSDGIGTAARFYYPTDIASDGAGNLFVADAGNHTIRKVVIATGEVTTLAGSASSSGSTDGIGAAARFNGPRGIASDRAGNLFVADSGNHTIRRIAIGTRTVTTVVGSPDCIGVALGPLPAGLNDPRGLALGLAGELYISDYEEAAILVAQF
jgi:hypothetical protein